MQLIFANIICTNLCKNLFQYVPMRYFKNKAKYFLAMNA